MKIEEVVFVLAKTQQNRFKTNKMSYLTTTRTGSSLGPVHPVLADIFTEKK